MSLPRCAITIAANSSASSARPACGRRTRAHPFDAPTRDLGVLAAIACSTSREVTPRLAIRWGSSQTRIA